MDWRVVYVSQITTSDCRRFPLWCYVTPFLVQRKEGNGTRVRVLIKRTKSRLTKWGRLFYAYPSTSEVILHLTCTEKS